MLCLLSAESCLHNYRTGAEARPLHLIYCGSLLVENRNGLLVLSTVWEATGMAECLAALEMLIGVRESSG
jgi:hypothetical protein